MPIVAERVDAVVGIDTHRDTHTVEIASSTGAVIATTVIDNDSAGYARLLAWITQRAPGPRVMASVEGTRSYGIGVTRALTRLVYRLSSASNPRVSNAEAGASPTRSTHTSRPCSR